jgi:sulfatase maturation enzyme AslB (radical SAM superfamily)
MPTGTITNGIALNDELINIIIESCRWIGFSVDAASDEAYFKIKRPEQPNAFRVVLDNIENLARMRKGDRPSIGMKFCISEANYEEIYDFVALSKEIGADDVHLRPVYIPGHAFSPDIAQRAQELITEARDVFESANFHVYGIMHKFDGSWKRKIDFKKCRATPVNAYFLANGTLALCCDRRNDPELNLGPYYPFDNVLRKWGSDEHKAMLANIEPQNCPRCTQTVCNKIIENVILEDSMCVRFV